MRTLIKNGTVVTAVDTFAGDVWIEGATADPDATSAAKICTYQGRHVGTGARPFADVLETESDWRLVVDAAQAA